MGTPRFTHSEILDENAFSEALKLFYECSKEKIFVDCVFCPCLEECLEFWNDWVIDSFHKTKKHYIRKIKEKLIYFRKQKLKEVSSENSRCATTAKRS